MIIRGDALSFSSMEERRPVQFSLSGQKLFGILHTPISEGPLPAVLILHGFAGSKVGYKRLYVSMAERLVQCGFAVLRFDFRGCGDSEGAFEDATIEGHMADTQAALLWLSEQPEIDANRIAILGVSLGGAVAALTASQTPLRSVALWSPVASGRLWQEDWAAHYPKEVLEGHIRCGGQTTSALFADQFLRMRADLAAGSAGDTPLLHIHGGRDGVVFPHHADLYKEARRGATTESAFLFLPNADHNYSEPSDREEVIEKTAEWFYRTMV